MLYLDAALLAGVPIPTLFPQRNLLAYSHSTALISKHILIKSDFVDRTRPGATCRSNNCVGDSTDESFNRESQTLSAMVIPSSQDEVCINCAEASSHTAHASILVEAPSAAVQRSSGSGSSGHGSKPTASRHMSNSNKNPFACVPREMRNNQLRTNLAAVAEQFKAVSNGQTSAPGAMPSPTDTSRARRFSADLVHYPQHSPGFAEGCQVTRAQSLQASFTAQQGILPPLMTGLDPSSSMPAYGCLSSSPHVASCSPAVPMMAAGSCLYSPAHPPPPPPPAQQLANQPYFNHSGYLPPQGSNSRSSSFEMQFNRLSGSYPEPRHNSVDLSPYMVHQMQQQLQQQMQQLQIQQEQTAAYAGLPQQQQTGMPSYPAYTCSDPLPHMNLLGGSSQTLPQQQPYVLSQPLLLNSGVRRSPSVSTPLDRVPMPQQQPVMLSASATLPPVSVALPTAQRPAGSMSNSELQQLQFDQQVQQVVQQHLLQLSGEF